MTPPRQLDATGNVILTPDDKARFNLLLARFWRHLPPFARLYKRNGLPDVLPPTKYGLLYGGYRRHRSKIDAELKGLPAPAAPEVEAEETSPAPEPAPAAPEVEAEETETAEESEPEANTRRRKRR